MFQPNDVREIREGIYCSRTEFAELLGRLRGVPISDRTIEAWELGAAKTITLYLTDLPAIKAATSPRQHTCEVCHANTAVVRKSDADLCQECAAPQTHRERRILKNLAATV